MVRVMIGYDPRQPIAYNVLQHSIIRYASVPVAITPLVLKQLPITRRGLTDFTFSRFLVPWLCGYEGRALFLDADMIVTGDIADLFNHFGPVVAPVSVMKNQQRFEWASAMFFDCAQCKVLTPQYVETGQNPLTLDWASSIGEIPEEWNHFVGASKAREAKLYHFSAGIPIWSETQGNREDAEWYREHADANASVSYQELMGKSVHAEQANGLNH